MINEYLEDCLYFTASRLSRALTKIAEESFSVEGLSPSYAFLLMTIYEKKSITPKELSEILHIAPSTVTRFLDKLELKGYINRDSEGKKSFITLTEKGKDIQDRLEDAWDQLYLKYVEILGEKDAEILTKLTNIAAKKLEI